MDGNFDRASEESETLQAQKTKQERIRENQRRSRARRQEYLQELERKISEFHLNSREADMQKELFWRVQLENARLRELLALVGVGPETIDDFVSRGAQPVSRDGDPSLRTLRPKFPMADDVQCLTDLSQAGDSSNFSRSGSGSGSGSGTESRSNSAALSVPVAFPVPMDLYTTPEPGSYGHPSPYETVNNVNMSGVHDVRLTNTLNTTVYDGIEPVKGYAQELEWVTPRGYPDGTQFYPPAPEI